MSRFAPALILLATSLQAAEGGWTWRETSTPHFYIKHQAAWLPPGFSMGAEKVHGRLRMDLGMFSPWMAKEKINLYIYADQASFLSGEFRPPKWSNGLAVYERKAVAMPSMKDPRKMIEVMAHETTHLLFDSYWREARKEPPSWINEGLAMLQEAESPDRPETSHWYQQMAYAEPKSFPDLETFFAVSPTKDLHDNEKAVATWYVQAYSITHFLLRKHSRLSFKSLCAQLRDGKPVAEALWLTYRYRHVADLDKKWRGWLKDPIHQRRIQALSAQARAGSNDEAITKTGLKGTGFTNFSTSFSSSFSKPAPAADGK
jgi:hypothetical protein